MRNENLEEFHAFLMHDHDIIRIWSSELRGFISVFLYFDSTKVGGGGLKLELVS